MAESDERRRWSAVRAPGQWVIGLVLVVVLVVVARTGGMNLLDRYVNHMAFYPTPGVDIDHRNLGRPVDSVFMTTTDEIKIHAYFLPEPSSPYVMLYLHGNAGNASHRLPTARDLAALGINVLLLDYRGYGLSEGQPSEAGVYLDARAALDYLNSLGFGDGRVIVFGRSLGGAVAIDLASHRPIGGVVLCSTFTSAADMAAAIGLGWVAPLIRGRFDSAAKIAAIDAPLLALHGTDDEVVPHALGRRLYEAATGKNKQWHDMPDTGHNDVMQAGAGVFWPALRSYLERLGALGGPSAAGLQHGVDL